MKNVWIEIILEIDSNSLPTKISIIGKAESKKNSIQIDKNLIEGKYLILETYYGQAQGGAFIPVQIKRWLLNSIHTLLSFDKIL